MTGQCTVRSATLRGVEAVPVDVEVAVSRGMPGFSIVGMPDAAIQEARERVRAALRSCGFSMPGDKVVVNLAPGSLKKAGSGFDLPIAVGVLVATAQVDPRLVKDRLFVGELSLEGSVRPVNGLLAYALCARRLDLGLMCATTDDGLIFIDGLEQLTLRTLGDLRTGRFVAAATAPQVSTVPIPDFSDVAGHDIAKRALQIAAAGGHGVLMMGPPGSGKTMLASRMPSILPPLSKSEVLATALIHSVAGEQMAPLLAGVRPFRSPHHSASLAGLVGGGSPPRPGEISLAHNGVLFLDELSEFKPSVLQGIRQPLEEGRVAITRADGNVVFPARFALVAASNPCPCGYFGDPEVACSCSLPQIRTYRNRIGGPLMDRIDLHLDVRRIPAGQVLHSGEGTCSTELREGVQRARAYASWRRARTGDDGPPGVRLPPPRLLRSCALSAGDEAFFEDAARANRMSGRAITRTLAVARTIADLDEALAVTKRHLCEALNFRVRDGVGS